MRLRVLITLIVVIGTLALANACGGSPANCNELCDREPTASAAEKDCVAAYVGSRFPATLLNATCQGISSPGECNSCYQQTNVPDATCAEAADQCL